MAANMKKMMNEISNFETAWKVMEKDQIDNLPLSLNRTAYETSGKYKFTIQLMREAILHPESNSIGKIYWVRKPRTKWTQNEKDALANMGYCEVGTIGSYKKEDIISIP